MIFFTFLPYFALCALAAYLLGSVNFAVVIGFFANKKDIRSLGSKNAGAANVFRCFGVRCAAAVALCDFAKGAVAALVSRFLAENCGGGETEFLFLAALCCTVGHVFPLYFGFRGGKGVLALSGAVFVYSQLCFVALLLLFIVVLLREKAVAAASVSCALALPAAVVLLGTADASNVLYCALSAYLASALLLWAHRGNVKRLLLGTEPRFDI